MKTKSLLIILFLSVNFSFAQTVPSYVPSTGLLGWWPFNGNAIDESANTNDGAVTGAILTTDRFGVSNKAYSFNGSSNYIDVNDAVPLRLNNTDYTISAWVYFNSTTGPDLISKRSAGSANGWDFTSTASTFQMHLSGGGSDPLASSTAVIVNLSWINVVLTYNNSTSVQNFFINGVFDATTTGFPTPNAGTTANMRFGGDILLSTYWLNGKLDDIGMWNRELTPTEIAGLYNASTVGIIESNNNSQINIYPNPTISTFSISGIDKKDFQYIEVSDLMGKLILKTTEYSNIDLSNFDKGIYFYKVVGDKSYTGKIIKD